MKNVSFFLAMSILLVFGGMAAYAEAGMTPGNPSAITFEIENQTPCFFFGGYQLSVGMRYDHFRFRASTQNSGHADFEANGIDSRSSKFKRFYDNGSFSVSADYFLNDYVFTYACLGSNRWLLRNNDTPATDNLRTLDAGVGLGVQYFFYKNLFLQLACHVNFRERKSLAIEGVEYTIPGIEYSPGLRLGIRF